MTRERAYRVTCLRGQQQFETGACDRAEESLIGFLELGALFFSVHQNASLSEAELIALHHQFKGGHRPFLPLHLIQRIDLVDRLSAALTSLGLFVQDSKVTALITE